MPLVQVFRFGDAVDRLAELDDREAGVAGNILDQEALILEWARLHQGELAEKSTLCSQLKSPKPIEPLE